MSKPTQPRPRQVTLLGWTIILGSAFVVLSAWDTVSRMRSLETREAIERFLSQPPGSGLGMSVEAVTEVLHVAALVTAGCGAAAGVLGWYALQGHRQARTALGVLAVPLFVAGLVGGGFISSLVAVAIAMLFFSPSKDWYAGRSLPTAPDREPLPPVQSATPPPEPPAYPTPQGSSVITRPAPAPTSDRRPDAVRTAVLITVVTAGFVLLLSLLGAVTLAVAADDVIDEMFRQQPQLAEQGVSRELVQNTSIVMSILFVVASGAAIACAVALLQGKRWGATGLVVLSVATAVFCLLASLGSLVALVPALAAVTVVALVRRPEVRAWLSRR